MDPLNLQTPILTSTHEPTLPPHQNPITESDSEDETDTIPNCHGGGPKPNKKRKLQEQKSKQKLKLLTQTLKLIPFTKPSIKNPNFEPLLKTLGLYDFTNLDFDQTLHFNLISQLIASYSHETRCGYVNGSRINLSRADLARALKLPSKKVVLDEEVIKFVDGFVGEWVLLHCDDAWMMPDEVVEWRKGLKEEELDKVDWAGLFWIMVEKELRGEVMLGECYYASHLQMVIRSQKKDLFSEEVDVKVEDSVEVKEVNDGGAGSSKECMVELNLGQEIVSEVVVAEEERGREEEGTDVEVNKEEEEEKWVWNDENHGYSNFLEGCGVGDGASGGDEKNGAEVRRVNEEEIEEEEDKHEGGFSLFPDGGTLHGVTQGSMMLDDDDDTSPLGYNNSELQNYGNSTGEFLASRGGNGMHMVPTSSFFGNGKREIEQEIDMSYQYGNPGTKRLRTDAGPSYDDDKPVAFEVCMELIKQLVDAAKVSYVEKDRACEESNMRQEMLVNELRRREDIIQQLEKKAYEEQHRKDVEIYQLENELRMMTSVLTGYRKALKETKKENRRHFRRCPLRNQPLYKDVKGSGGLVLSIGEIEKLRLKQEEEEGLRQAQIESQVEELGSRLIKEFEANVDKRLELVDEKLNGFQTDVKLLKETRVSRRKVLNTPTGET